MTADAVPPTRHAPPHEIRLPMQRERLLRAAASEFADVLGLAPVIDRLILGLIPANE